MTGEKLAEINQTIASLDETDLGTQADIQKILDDLGLLEIVGDGVVSSVDNCPANSNPDPKNTDLEGKGDACDIDDTVLESNISSVHGVVATDSLIVVKRHRL